MPCAHQCRQICVSGRAALELVELEGLWIDLARDREVLACCLDPCLSGVDGVVVDLGGGMLIEN